MAGLGRMSGAGKRLYLYCKQLSTSHEVVRIDEKNLTKIALVHGVNPDIFTQSRGYGHWQWKILLIFHYLGKGYNEIVYLDVGCDINLVSFSKLLNWFEKQVDFELILARTKQSIAKYTKPSSVRYILGETSLSNALDTIEMFAATITLLKANTGTICLYEKALNLIQQGKHFLFDDSKYRSEDMNGKCILHMGDQSILNLLLLDETNDFRTGALNSSLTPPDHLTGWNDFPPIIAARNSSCCSLYWIILRYGSLKDAPKHVRFIWRLFTFLAAKTDYPSFLLSAYIRLEGYLLSAYYLPNQHSSVFGEDSDILRFPALLDL